MGKSVTHMAPSPNSRNCNHPNDGDAFCDWGGNRIGLGLHWPRVINQLSHLWSMKDEHLDIFSYTYELKNI